MPSNSSPYVFTAGLDGYVSITSNKFIALAHKMLSIYHVSWPVSESTDLSAVSSITEASYSSSRYRSVVLRDIKPACWVGYVRIDADNTLEADIAVDSADDFEAVKQFLLSMFPASKTEKNNVSFQIWAHGQNGPVSYSRTMFAPDFDSLMDNYTPSVAASLHSVFDLKPPVLGGRIILWQGQPGTGKTYAVRALAKAWSSWCSLDYISDPEIFFGRSPSYMMNVVLGSRYHDDNEVAKHKLLVLEDAGELIAADARSQSGQGLSRLLNLADGILGQGMQMLILITTNEELGALNEAVQRPGRCLNVISFDKLSIVQANAWLAAHGSDAHVTESKSVAELYAILDSRVTGKTQRKIGFGA